MRRSRTAPSTIRPSTAPRHRAAALQRDIDVAGRVASAVADDHAQWAQRLISRALRLAHSPLPRAPVAHIQVDAERTALHQGWGPVYDVERTALHQGPEPASTGRWQSNRATWPSLTDAAPSSSSGALIGSPNCASSAPRVLSPQQAQQFRGGHVSQCHNVVAHTRAVSRRLLPHQARLVDSINSKSCRGPHEAVAARASEASKTPTGVAHSRAVNRLLPRQARLVDINNPPRSGGPHESVAASKTPTGGALAPPAAMLGSATPQQLVSRTIDASPIAAVWQAAQKEIDGRGAFAWESEPPIAGAYGNRGEANGRLGGGNHHTKNQRLLDAIARTLHAHCGVRLRVQGCVTECEAVPLQHDSDEQEAARRESRARAHARAMATAEALRARGVAAHRLESCAVLQQQQHSNVDSERMDKHMHTGTRTWSRPTTFTYEMRFVVLPKGPPSAAAPPTSHGKPRTERRAARCLADAYRLDEAVRRQMRSKAVSQALMQHAARAAMRAEDAMRAIHDGRE